MWMLPMCWVMNFKVKSIKLVMESDGKSTNQRYRVPYRVSGKAQHRKQSFRFWVSSYDKYIMTWLLGSVVPLYASIWGCLKLFRKGSLRRSGRKGFFLGWEKSYEEPKAYSRESLQQTSWAIHLAMLSSKLVFGVWLWLFLGSLKPG